PVEKRIFRLNRCLRATQSSLYLVKSPTPPRKSHKPCNLPVYFSSNRYNSKFQTMKNPKIFWSGILLSGLLCATTSFAQDTPKLSDAEVASVAVVANQIDIEYADIAKEKSKDAEIIKFAETMINDHKAVIAQAAALVKKL